MLPERVTQLLTAYVDGELSARERRAVGRLLRKSPEARAMLHQMKQDSMVLRKLPRKKTQLDLSGSVMGTISLRNIQLPKIENPVPLSPKPVVRRRPFWLKVTAAAVLLCAVGLASYFVVSFVLHGSGHATAPEPTNPDDPRHRQGNSEADVPAPVITVLHEPEGSPVGKNDRNDERLRLGHIRPPAFVQSTPRLMQILPLRDLEQTSRLNALTQEFSQDDATRLDLFCLTDTSRALERLQAVFKANNVNLRIDGYAQARMKQKLKTNLAIYSEELTPEELAALLHQLATDDKKPGNGNFDKLTVTPTTPPELARVLGGEPGFFQQPERTGPLGVDLTQDVSSKTGSHIVQALTGKGTRRPTANTAPDPNTPRQAVLVPYSAKPEGLFQEIRNLV
ncbi:MAG: zf-HC2 domain-containing protein, partial [Planctomycetia bacterium]|nr:zf-HC2 domain-containing protein [Planctomycetia bacterium]